MALDINYVRQQFPALTLGGLYLDNPGGSQVVRHCLQAMEHYLIETNSNRGGAFATSLASDAVITRSRQALASLLHAAKPEEIVFGPNMTSITLAVSRSLAVLLEPEDELIVTRLDHDANISPWLQAADSAGCQLHWIDFDRASGRLNLDQLEAKLNDRTKLVAVGYASNALGTINPIGQICQMARQVGAWTYVDAVQYAPHGPIDVQQLDCDFLVASAYKLFGPHLGFLYGRYDLLNQLPAFKVRPASNLPPGKFETGTQNHEGISGLLGTMDYLADLGDRFGQAAKLELQPRYHGRALDLKAAMSTIGQYEHDLTQYLLERLDAVEGIQIYGPPSSKDRVPTVSFRLGDLEPRQVAKRLGEQDIYLWDGNFYALAVTEHLGLEQSGGLVRVGLVHYNTRAEVDQLIEALQQLSAS